MKRDDEWIGNANEAREMGLILTGSVEMSRCLGDLLVKLPPAIATCEPTFYGSTFEDDEIFAVLLVSDGVCKGYTNKLEQKQASSLASVISTIGGDVTAQQVADMLVLPSEHRNIFDNSTPFLQDDATAILAISYV